MTLEEQRRLAALMKLKNPLGMVNQTVVTPRDIAAAAQDYTGTEEGIDYQRALAAEMLTTEGPQGRMMGNIYAAPNWAESLSGAATKLVGGYQMGQANKREAAMMKEQKVSNAALAKTMLKKEEDKAIREDNKIQREADKAELTSADKGLDRAAKAQLEKTKAAAAAARFSATEAGKNSRAKGTNAELDALKLEEARLKVENLKNPGIKIDSVTRRRMGQEASAAIRLNESIAETKALKARGGETGKPVVDYLSEKARNLPLVGGESTSNYVLAKGYTPEEQAVRGKLDSAVNPYRRAMTGANLTMIETILDKNWDPTAPGISTEEKVARSERLINTINNNREAFDLNPLLFDEGGKTDSPATPDTSGVPAGVPPEDWAVMTPEEKALFQ